jgi:hypothetical protein
LENLSSLQRWVFFLSSEVLIQRSGFDSRRYQIFWEVVGLERGALSLVSTVEELLGRKSSGSGVETEITAVGDLPRQLRVIPLSAKVVTDTYLKNNCSICQIHNKWDLITQNNGSVVGDVTS